MLLSWVSWTSLALPRGYHAPPVPNPFQIHALRNQAQGVNVLQMRRPLLGNGNAFAQQQQQQQQQQQAQAQETEVVRQPRGDSLPAPPEVH